MKTIQVWYLVTVSNGNVVYSPPMPTLEECEKLEKVIPNTVYKSYVQINEVLK